MDVSKQMSAILDLNKDNYKSLCSLYIKYKHAIKIALENVNFRPIADIKANELDKILEKIEQYPISWKYYNCQESKFSPEFEGLIIFHDEVNISK